MDPGGCAHLWRCEECVRVCSEQWNETTGILLDQRWLTGSRLICGANHACSPFHIECDRNVVKTLEKLLHTVPVLWCSTIRHVKAVFSRELHLPWTHTVCWLNAWITAAQPFLLYIFHLKPKTRFEIPRVEPLSAECNNGTTRTVAGSAKKLSAWK